MNLVELIKEQLPGGLINQLSSQVGASEGATRSAVMAAVPAMLSALAGLSSWGVRAPRSSSRPSRVSGPGRSRVWFPRCRTTPHPCSNRGRAF